MIATNSVLDRLRAKGILTAIATDTPVPEADGKPQIDVEAEMVQAVSEVSQPSSDALQPVEVPTVPVSALSPRHQRQLGLPVTKEKSAGRPAKNGQTEMVRAIWRKYQDRTLPGA